MRLHYQKHYTLEEARALLPRVRGWLERLNQLNKRRANYDRQITQMIEGGCDAGGHTVNNGIKTLVEMKSLLGEFQSREIQVKDLERGLIDFPAIIGGKEVFLCWEQDEEDIEFWHDLDTGYAGRERL